MIRPSARFFRQSVVLSRRAWGRDAASGPVDSDADAGQTVACAVQEIQGRDAESLERHGDSIVARRRFDVLIPSLHPSTGAEQFPAATYPDGPAVRQGDLVEWDGRTLSVVADADKAGRGAYGHIITLQCVEVV